MPRAQDALTRTRGPITQQSSDVIGRMGNRATSTLNEVIRQVGGNARAAMQASTTRRGQDIQSRDSQAEMALRKEENDRLAAERAKVRIDNREFGKEMFEKDASLKRELANSGNRLRLALAEDNVDLQVHLANKNTLDRRLQYQHMSQQSQMQYDVLRRVIDRQMGSENARIKQIELDQKVGQDWSAMVDNRDIIGGDIYNRIMKDPVFVDPYDANQERITEAEEIQTTLKNRILQRESAIRPGMSYSFPLDMTPLEGYVPYQQMWSGDGNTAPPSDTPFYKSVGDLIDVPEFNVQWMDRSVDMGRAVKRGDLKIDDLNQIDTAVSQLKKHFTGMMKDTSLEEKDQKTVRNYLMKIASWESTLMELSTLRGEEWKIPKPGGGKTVETVGDLMSKVITYRKDGPPSIGSRAYDNYRSEMGKTKDSLREAMEDIQSFSGKMDKENEDEIERLKELLKKPVGGRARNLLKKE